MKKIIILDFSTSEVHVFNYDTNIYEEYEDFYTAMDDEGYNFTDSNCQCLITENLNIQIH
jgi:hypothetical protein